MKLQHIFIQPETYEWAFMWEWLDAHPLNEGIAIPSLAQNGDDVWKYMGTYKMGPDAIHSFRHMNHPKTKEVSSLSLRASDNFIKNETNSTT